MSIAMRENIWMLSVLRTCETSRIVGTARGIFFHSYLCAAICSSSSLPEQIEAAFLRDSKSEKTSSLVVSPGLFKTCQRIPS